MQEVIDKILKLRKLGAGNTPEAETARSIAQDLMRKYKLAEKDIVEKVQVLVLVPPGSPTWQGKIARTLCVYFDVPGARVFLSRGEPDAVECDDSPKAKRALKELSTILLMCKTSRLHKRLDLLAGFADGFALELDRKKPVKSASRQPPVVRRPGTVLPDPAKNTVTVIQRVMTPSNSFEYDLGMRMGTEAALRIVHRRGSP